VGPNIHHNARDEPITSRPLLVGGVAVVGVAAVAGLVALAFKAKAASAVAASASAGAADAGAGGSYAALGPDPSLADQVKFLAEQKVPVEFASV
jgi:hypothetical protein